MDRYISTLFRDEKITLQTVMTDINGIGKYLYKRIKDGLRINGDLTIRKFVIKFRNKTSSEITEILQLILQNQRGNQCVTSKTKRIKKYHTRDVNKRGYNICVSILRYVKKNLDDNLTFGRLRNAVEQTEDTKRCGCMTKNQCQRSPMCSYKNRTCIPKNNNAIGFEGVGKRPGQIKKYTTPIQKNKILNDNNIVKNQSFYRDPDTVQDDSNRHTSPKYLDHNSVLWRKNGKVIRSPRKY